MEILSGWTIYAFTRIPALTALCATAAEATGVALVILSIMAIFCLLGFILSDNAENLPAFLTENPIARGLKRTGKFLLVAFIVLHVAVAAIPTQKEVAAIYIIPKVVNNEMVQKATINTGQGVINLTELFREWTVDVGKSITGNNVKEAAEPVKVIKEVTKEVKEESTSTTGSDIKETAKEIAKEVTKEVKGVSKNITGQDVKEAAEAVKEAAKVVKEVTKN